MENKKLESAKGLYLEGIRDGKIEEALDKYTGAVYKQHSTGVKDGKKGFREFFESFIERNKVRDIRVVREIVDGNYVFLHVYQELNNGESRWVTGDIFDTDENDKVIEHWDVIQEYIEDHTYEYDMINGDTEIEDLDKTESNKKIVDQYHENVLLRDDNHDLFKYIDETSYIEHATIDLAHSTKNEGKEYRKHSFIYSKHHILMGQGNFVVTYSKVQRYDGVFKLDLVVIDIYKLHNNMIIEHWDVVEKIVPKRKQKNSGKF